MDFRVKETLFLSGDDNQALQCKQQWTAKTNNTVFSLCIAQLIKLQLWLPDYHLPSAFHLNCAAHMGNVDDFKVTDFSGWLWWMNSVLQLYGTEVWRGLNKQTNPPTDL